jgi:phage FluMu protein gp41
MGRQIGGDMDTKFVYAAVLQLSKSGEISSGDLAKLSARELSRVMAVAQELKAWKKENDEAHTSGVR